VIAVHIIPKDWTGLNSRLLRPLVLCGQWSLEVFCVGIFLSFVGHFVLEMYSDRLTAQIGVSLGGLMLMTCVASYTTWSRKLDAPVRTQDVRIPGNRERGVPPTKRRIPHEKAIPGSDSCDSDRWAAAGAFMFSGGYDVGADTPHWVVTEKFMENVRDRSIAFHANEIQIPDMKDEQLTLKGAGQYAAMCAFVGKLPGLSAQQYEDIVAKAPPDEDSMNKGGGHQHEHGGGRDEQKSEPAKQGSPKSASPHQAEVDAPPALRPARVSTPSY
jgi:hypothetical protein